MELTVVQQVAALQKASLPVLRERWRVLMGTEPPKAYNSARLVRRLAWRLQELHYGGLSHTAKARLRLIAEADELARRSLRQSKRRKNVVTPGTRLVRTWRGAEHIVTAIADGSFEYNGRRYRTLTAVAKDITGQHLSGMRFFGLAENKEAK